ncbi:MAG: PQQ-dependent polyvinyl-alcohol dehydrogenase [Bryobacterales bacterium]|nr:PQQ-dependent polyvinyl-alcohol dehydrogenase [Bryobacterales bacterium]
MKSFILVIAAATAAAQTPDAIFQSRCAACHSTGNVMGAPVPELLRQMSSKAILTALETGRMKGVGAGMSVGERETVAKFLGTSDSQPAPASAKCSAAPPGKNTADWNGWADAANTRFQTAKAAGLNRQTTPKLKLKWAFGFPGVTTAFGSPTVFDGRIFVGAADGAVYSLDARTGCVYWTYTAAAGVRVAPVIGGKSVYFGDLRGNVYALDIATGRLLWKTRADEHPLAVITGSPKLDGGRLYVPVSGRDESIAATNPTYECCTFRGSVVALDAVTGKRIWQAYTIVDTPKVTGQNAKGVKTWGPSGAVPWSSPTLDLQKRVLYIGTGVNYSNPPTDTSDAIVAVDMDSGRLLWSRQFTDSDTYNFACGAEDKTNCPKYPFIDADFGHSPILRSLGGRRILVAGDKGGMVYGIDPDQQGKILWKQKIASGGVNGGFMWGGASDEQGVAYLGISDFTAGKPEIGGGLVALQLATGERLWMTPAPKPACLAVPGCSAAQPAAVTVIPGVAFLGSSDGHVWAYETTKGAIIWDFDTMRDFETVNGVNAHGGSINSVGPAVAAGMLYITSGYSGNGMPGNVLLGFSVDGK